MNAGVLRAEPQHSSQVAPARDECEHAVAREPVGASRCLVSAAGSEVHPFRPIPGAQDEEAAIELSCVTPKDFYAWGKCFESEFNAHNTPLPEDVRETWRLGASTSAI